MRGHVLLVGYGSGGRRIAEALAGIGADIIVIEANPNRAAQARTDGRDVVLGDATDPSVLRQARAAESDVIALTASELDDGVVKAIRRVRPVGLVLTHVSKGFVETDATAAMIGRLLRVLGQSVPIRQ